jgi:nitroimidazol reductase NimA-like FMN-containing flavoprotein (pyridoxamine 5'-phosphate oxidase superfamily)
VLDDEARQFTALNERQCRDLLQGTSLGRVAWQSADGPQILPVTFACHGDSLIFRTSPYGPLSDLVQPTDVAFEADELDQRRRSGWSVVVQGRAAVVAEPAEVVKLWTVDGLVPWAPGDRNVFIEITPRRNTGRVLRHDPDPSSTSD